MRVLAIADSDSYVKWAAAMLGRMPDEWQVSLVIMTTPKRPSAAQLEAALSGSGIHASDVATLPFERAVTHVVSEHPDVVLVATIGPLADVVTEAVLARSERAPVVVSGVPGIALPARRKALIYRSQSRLIVLHSTRELRRFQEIANENHLPCEFALATLPFLADRGQGGDPNGSVVFAAQAIVPPTRVQRVAMLRTLISFAGRYPHLRVVIKVRATGGEGQTHAEQYDYARLLAADFNRVPANLVVEGGPMADHLRSASALVTVSSTAAIEAVAAGIPVLIIDDFGVSADLINEVFVGSGLLGSTADLAMRNFKHPDGEWLRDNYFHDDADNSWVAAIDRLVEQNRAGLLPWLPRLVRGGGGELRRAWDRKRALGSADRSLIGFVALALGMPARTVVLGLHSLLRTLGEPQSPQAPLALNHAATPLGNDREPTAHSR